MIRLTVLLFAVVVWGQIQTPHSGAAETVQWHAGFARVEVTPREPMRLSGYGNRDHPFESVEAPLFVRAVCIRPGGADHAGELAALLTIDNVGLSGKLTRELAAELERRHGIRRSRLVFCNTHTHSAPTLNDQLANIFSTPLGEAEVQAAQRYRNQVSAAVYQAIGRAIGNLAPAELSYGVARAGFASNRRVLAEGRWTGFGVQDDGPVDHSVPVLRIRSPDGKKLRGVVFNYACHCTTIGGDDYRVNADWAGYAVSAIESAFPGAQALCTIGCGADSNPNPRGTADLSRMHGQSLADSVASLIGQSMKQVNTDLEARFDYSALSFELPTREELEERLGDTRPQTRRHAEKMIRIYDEMGRLPATYPVPIQSWQFGDQLGMVFIGGEVVVDYALRLKKTLGQDSLWVSAYSNDVMGYIASERMRVEGGYEYDRSGIYYSLPGPWASGSEDQLVSSIVRLIGGEGRAKPVPPDESTGLMRVSQGFDVELVASEPLIQDPINLAFSANGDLWVVEMGDYPEGDSSGRIKRLVDSNSDGRYDKATVFLDGLSFPTGAHPWRDGLIVTCAPDVLFARDTDHDGSADQVEKLYTGFPLANPQHRINGLTYGLDHSLHLASGDKLGSIESVAQGVTIDAAGHDVKIWPDTGGLTATSGRSQFIRSRDAFGRWFGNSNSRPMFHYPIEDRYLARNRAASYGSNSESLFVPPMAPPVYPTTSTDQRFNDLFAAGRFTSACSSIVAENPGFEAEIDGAIHPSVFICEPVHNLLHRSALVAVGASFRAARTAEEAESEFLSSEDPWFRPVRVINGPDGALYLVDMYRQVIEHPEWIPTSWQERLDVRAGQEYGRIYRITPEAAETLDRADLSSLSQAGWVSELNSPIAARRDIAQRLLLHDQSSLDRKALVELALDHRQPLGQIHALSILDVAGGLRNESLVQVLLNSDAGVRMVALRLCESRLKDLAVLKAVTRAASHTDVTVAFQAALCLGESDSEEAADALCEIALRNDLDQWLADAIICSASVHAPAIVSRLLSQIRSSPETMAPIRFQLLGRLMGTALESDSELRRDVSAMLTSSSIDLESRFQLAECVAAIASRGRLGPVWTEVMGPIRNRAKSIATNDLEDEGFRCRAVSLVSLLETGRGDREAFLISLLDPAVPVAVQCEAVRGLGGLGSSTWFSKLCKSWDSLSQPVRNELIGAVLSSRVLAESLLEELESGRVGANDLPLAYRQQLLHTGSRSMRVRARRVITAGGTGDRTHLVRRYLSEFEPESNPLSSDSADQSFGRDLFAKHCGTCHQPDDGLIAVGPNLSNLSNRSDLALVEAILDPNRAVEPKYQSYVVETREGRTLAGMVESEVGNSLTLAHADGKRTTIRRDEIERLKNLGLSLMPEGFESVLSPSQLQAIVRHLQLLEP